MKKLILIIIIFASVKTEAQRQDIARDSVMKTGHFNVSLMGGLSWRVAQTDPAANQIEKAYIKDLKSGKSFSITARYFFKKKFGVGLKFNTHLSKVQFNDLYMEYNGQNYYGSLSDDIAINSYAAVFSGRFYNRSHTGCFTFDGGLAFMTYRDDARIAQNKILVEGLTAGINLSAGYALSLSRNIAVTLGFDYVMGTLTEYDQTENGVKSRITLEENQAQGLAHIDVMAGLIISF